MVVVAGFEVSSESTMDCSVASGVLVAQAVATRIGIRSTRQYFRIGIIARFRLIALRSLETEVKSVGFMLLCRVTRRKSSLE